MVPELPPPDLEISLHPDDHAPRAARYCVRTVDRPSPRSRQRGHELAITPGSQQVQRLLTVTGVSDQLRIIAAPDELLV
jgi:hypothetical protein